MDALALAAALAQPWADIVLSGAVTMKQLRSNVRALDIDLDLVATGSPRGPRRGSGHLRADTQQSEVELSRPAKYER